MISLWIAAAIIVLAIIALVAIYIHQRRRKNQSAALGEKSMELSPHAGDEISSLIREAEAKLSAARLPYPRVRQCPVYLIIGDTGAAKTSTMLHSGIEAELIAGQVSQSGNVTPTRGANIWFARGALFVEASGSLLNDSRHWKTLVRRLQARDAILRKGPHPARAAVVLYDCETFTRTNAAETSAACARALRSRLGEICESFGIKIPVYVLFTKLDRVPFFTEYVRNFSNDEAAQAFGVAFPMTGAQQKGSYAQEQTLRLTAGFERLFQSLADGRVEFLARETDPAKLPVEYEFPREFRKIRDMAVRFLVDVCRPSQLTIGPFLRGFYFSGVRPLLVNDAGPIQPAAQEQQSAAASRTAATGIFANVTSPLRPALTPQPVMATRRVPQWMFLNRFFNDVLLADGGAMIASGPSLRARRGRGILLKAGAAVCLLAALLFTVSFVNNRSLENEVSGAARAIGPEEAVGADFASVDSLGKLDALRAVLERLSQWHRTHPPITYRWGLYVGDELYPATRRLYFKRFKELLFGKTQDNDLEFLNGLPSTHGPEYQPTYDALKAYLITTSNHDKSAESFMAPELMRLWQANRTADADMAKLAKRQFEFYSNELKRENPYGSENDGAAVKRARHYLANFGDAPTIYDNMVQAAGKASQPVNFNRSFSGSESIIVDKYDVPGAFTKAGWNFMKDAFAHPEQYFGGERWVLGDVVTDNYDPSKLRAELRAAYDADYIKNWATYLKSASLVPYTGLTDASSKLNQLSNNQSTMLELFFLASNNTNVDDESVAAMFQPVRSVIKPGSGEILVAPENKAYVVALGSLQISVESAANANDADSEKQKARARGDADQALKTVKDMSASFRPDRTNGVDSLTDALLREPIVKLQPLIQPAADFWDVLSRRGKYVTHEITFDTNSDRLKPESDNPLSQIAAALKAHPDLKVEINGYTDSVGNAAHNLNLSKRRAQSVAAALVSKGVTTDRLTDTGFGAENPIASNDTAEGKAANRRVEFLKK
jgi:type VI secretion system protein ImpL